MQKTYDESIRYTVEKSDVVKADVIDVVEYQYRSERDIDITIRHPEFTSVCPMTGLPDSGCITVRYCPEKKIVELKSLKYYLLQYRNVGIFYEHVVNRILDDLVSRVEPKTMSVEGEFTARGGITSKVVAEFQGVK